MFSLCWLPLATAMLTTGIQVFTLPQNSSSSQEPPADHESEPLMLLQSMAEHVSLDLLARQWLLLSPGRSPGWREGIKRHLWPTRLLTWSITYHSSDTLVLNNITLPIFPAYVLSFLDSRPLHKLCSFQWLPSWDGQSTQVQPRSHLLKKAFLVPQAGLGWISSLFLHCS
jgi:hypothetical protein